VWDARGTELDPAAGDAADAVAAVSEYLGQLDAAGQLARQLDPWSSMYA
jgi:hypothetical protein